MIAKKTSASAAKSYAARRSPCPVASLLDVVGDKWTILVIRDLLLGRSRFKDFISSPEKIPTNILTERLERLLHHQIIEQIHTPDSTKRFAYRLTPKGLSFRPVVESMRDWGLKWDSGTFVGLKPRKKNQSGRGG